MLNVDISVIMPVYNAQKYLEESLNSILCQTFDDFELIIIDDGSTDNSYEICERYKEKDERIIVIHQINQGPSVARNIGIKKAIGKYIVFCDSDDILDKNALSLLYNAMEKYNADLAICGYSRFTVWGTPLLEQRFLTKYSYTILKSNIELASVYFSPKTNMFGISIWGKMYRADIIHKNNILFSVDQAYEEDCCFNVNYFKHVNTTVFLRNILYHYRQQNTSLSKVYKPNVFDGLLKGYCKRRQFLIDIGLEASVSRLKLVFMFALFNTYKKIKSSSLKRKDRIKEYERILSYKEVQQVMCSSKLSQNRLTRWLTLASRACNPQLIDGILGLWVIVRYTKSNLKKALRKLFKGSK